MNIKEDLVAGVEHDRYMIGEKQRRNFGFKVYSILNKMKISKNNGIDEYAHFRDVPVIEKMYEVHDRVLDSVERV